MLAHLGRVEELHRLITELRSAILADDELEATPFPILTTILEVALLLEASDIAGPVAEALASTADMACFAPAAIPSVPARLLGETAALLGKLDEARACYIRALEVAARIRFRPEIALTRLRLAELLIKHYPGMHPEAIEHLDFAIGEFRGMKMQPALERALRHKGLLKA